MNTLEPTTTGMDRRKGKGQALVEMALMSLLLGLFLAAAIDFGRAFYTLTVVTNMAGEGAAFAALYPDQDQVTANQVCSILTPDDKKTIQERARLVAKDRGLVIEEDDQQSAIITVTTSEEDNNFGETCRARCAGRRITVTVRYTINDLFLPGFLGMTEIPITRSATQLIMRDVDRNAACP
jgi:Flp pilus assembly protein TadG